MEASKAQGLHRNRAMALTLDTLQGQGRVLSAGLRLVL